jgi:hypothetical protein
VLLLHGFPEDATGWTGVMSALAARGAGGPVAPGEPNLISASAGAGTDSIRSDREVELQLGSLVVAAEVVMGNHHRAVELGLELVPPRL